MLQRLWDAVTTLTDEYTSALASTFDDKGDVITEQVAFDRAAGPHSAVRSQARLRKSTHQSERTAMDNIDSQRRIRRSGANAAPADATCTHTEAVPGPGSPLGRSITPLRDELELKVRSSGMKPRQEESSCFALLRWGLKHLQLSLLLLAIGMLVATSYASGIVYSMGETLKDILVTLKLAKSSIRLVDRAVGTTLLVSWLLAGVAVLGGLLRLLKRIQRSKLNVQSSQPEKWE